jgi:hypothetical protein
VLIGRIREIPWLLEEKEGPKTMRTICILSLIALLSLAQTKDISGTWVAKRQTPNGEMELVYELKVNDGKITGTQKMPFGDSLS